MGNLSFEEAQMLVDNAKRPWGLSPEFPASIQPAFEHPAVTNIKTPLVRSIELAVRDAVRRSQEVSREE